jgi:hypothetical protein
MAWALMSACQSPVGVGGGGGGGGGRSMLLLLLLLLLLPLLLLPFPAPRVLAVGADSFGNVDELSVAEEQ